MSKKDLSISLEECQKIALELNISSEQTDIDAAVVFLFGSLNRIHNVIYLSQATGINRDFIMDLYFNLFENKIWDGRGNTDANIFDKEDGWMEIILCVMCATGHLMRYQEINQNK